MVVICCQAERAPKKHVVEEFEEFDYSDLYEEISTATVSAGPNVTEYEVSEEALCVSVAFYIFLPSFSSSPCLVGGQIIEYEDYDNTTGYGHADEYEYEEEYDERFGPAQTERGFSLNARVPAKPAHAENYMFN